MNTKTHTETKILFIILNILKLKLISNTNINQFTEQKKNICMISSSVSLKIVRILSNNNDTNNNKIITK